MNKTIKAHLALLIANLIYSANYTIAKQIMPDYIQPFGFIFIRVLGALILFWTISVFFVKEKADKKDIPMFAVLGLFGVAINQLLFFKGLNITTPINASIMMVSTPLLVLIVAVIMAKEKLIVKKLAGIIIGFTGAMMLLLVKKDFSLGTYTMRGDAFILINALSWGIYLVLVKPYMMKYNTITIVKWIFLFGLIFVTPFGFEEFTEINWTEFPAHAWWGLAFVVIATTCIAYILNTYALKALSASVVSAYIYLQPFLAALIAIGFGKDELNWVKVVSAVLIIGGVYLTSKSIAASKGSKRLVEAG